MLKKILIFLSVCLFFTVSVASSDISRNIPILAYHSIDNTSGQFSVTKQKLEKDILSLKNDGYTFVSFENILDFVYNNGVLPQKCVVITFDDGYKNNYTELTELSEKLDFKYEIFAVAGFISQTDQSMSWEQAREIDSGEYGNIGCHTFNMHTQDSLNFNVLKKPGDNFSQWEHRFRNDLAFAHWLFSEQLGEAPELFAYPYGAFCSESEQVLRETGYKVTVTTEPGINTVIRNNPESLYLLMRLSMDGKKESAANIIKKYSNTYTNKKIEDCKKTIAKQKASGESYVSRRSAFYMLYADDIEKDYTYYPSTDNFTDGKYMDKGWSYLLSWGVYCGLLKGYDDLTLRPLHYISRGEFAVMLARHYGITEDGKVIHTFSDSSDWNRTALSWCAENDYMIGNGDGTFGAEELLTENQFSIIYNRLSR